MKITRDNYEIYFIDYLDGNLSTDAIRELKAFLLVNRDLEELLEDTENCRIEPSREQFIPKESLKKTVCHECPDYYAIAAAENELTATDKTVLGKRLHSPVFQSLACTYEKLKLKPDPTLRFEKKRQLYRHFPQKIIFYQAIGIAAGLLLLFGIGFSFLRTDISPDSQPVKYEIPLPVAGYSASPSIPAPEFPAKEPQTTRQKRTGNNPPEVCKKIQAGEIASFQAEKRQILDELPAIRITEIPIAAVENNEPDMPLGLVRTPVTPSEIFLTDNALNWKQSDAGLLSDNIITSAINTGKNLTEIIKERIAERRSNKSFITYVIH